MERKDKHPTRMHWRSHYPELLAKISVQRVFQFLRYCCKTLAVKSSKLTLFISIYPTLSFELTEAWLNSLHVSRPFGMSDEPRACICFRHLARVVQFIPRVVQLFSTGQPVIWNLLRLKRISHLNFPHNELAISFFISCSAYKST